MGNWNCRVRGTLNRRFNGMDTGSNMGGKRQKHTNSVQPLSFADSLQQQMSEVISLREKVAQAELEARRHCNVAEGRRLKRREGHGRRAKTRSPTSQPASA